MTWDRIREFDGLTESSFQVTLFADGAFELIYGGISAQSGIAGWSGGRNTQTLGLVDLSASSGICCPVPRLSGLPELLNSTSQLWQPSSIRHMGMSTISW